MHKKIHKNINQIENKQKFNQWKQNKQEARRQDKIVLEKNDNKNQDKRKNV